MKPPRAGLFDRLLVRVGDADRSGLGRRVYPMGAAVFANTRNEAGEPVSCRATRLDHVGLTHGYR